MVGRVVAAQSARTRPRSCQLSDSASGATARRHGPGSGIHAAPQPRRYVAVSVASARTWPRHRGLQDVDPRGAVELEDRIERRQGEPVVMRPGRRAWTAVSELAEAVRSLRRRVGRGRHAERQPAGRACRSCRRPASGRSHGRRDRSRQDERPGRPVGRAGPGQVGRHVLAVAGEAARDRAAVLEGGAGQA